MARDKLITIRIEGEKREAFNQLAKSQNTDTASLLYDFISGCLDGRIDIKLVTGKGNRLDKIDNRIDSNRIDKLETDTQRIDHWIGALSERLNDWILRSDRRLTDSDQGLSEKIISLEHRLNALAIQLDSQQLDSIDTDSQEIDDMEQLLRLQRESSIAAPIPTGEPSPLPNQETVETDSSIEPVTDAIASIDGTVEAVYTVETADTVEPISSIELDKGAIETAIKVKPRRGYSNSELSEKLNISKSTIEKWKARIQRGEKFEPKVYPNFFDHWLLDTDNLWYPEGRLLKKP